MAIPVIFTIFMIVLVVVTDQVIESHAIVGGDEIDAELPAFFSRPKYCRASKNGFFQCRHLTLISSHRLSDSVPEKIIPLGPNPHFLRDTRDGILQQHPRVRRSF